MNAIQYNLSESDFMALNYYMVRRHWRYMVLQVLSPGVGLGAVTFFMLRGDTHDTRASLVTAIVVGLIASLLYALYYRSQLNTAVSKQLTADPHALGPREVLLTPEGFRESTQINDSFHKWVGFDSIGITPSHVFLHLNRFTAYIIPRSVLPPDALVLIGAAVPNSRVWRSGV